MASPARGPSGAAPQGEKGNQELHMHRRHRRHTRPAAQAPTLIAGVSACRGHLVLHCPIVWLKTNQGDRVRARRGPTLPFSPLT